MAAQDFFDDLELARRHVVEAELRVAEQRDRVAMLDRLGVDAEPAKRLLATLEQSLNVMRDHLAIEERFARRIG